MIELIVTGGLGNQMFQYACARQLQLEHKDELKLNINLYSVDKFGRQYSLDACSIPNTVSVINHSVKMIRLMGGLSNYAENLVFSIMKPLGIYVWKGKTYRKLECTKRKNVLYGYFQSEKYFAEYSDIIKKELKISKSISDENRRWIKEIDSVNAVCMHVRRGDYLKENFLVCDVNYYENAVAYMREHLDNPKIFVFSDDIDWVKSNFQDSELRFVDNNNMDYDELRLMYHCKHFIMSNSSFSWWAQYLSDNEDRMVIAPSRWIPDGSIREIYMDNWVILE